MTPRFCRAFVPLITPTCVPRRAQAAYRRALPADIARWLCAPRATARRGARDRPNPGAARDAPRISREPGPHFRIRLYTGQYNKENVLPVPVFGKSTRELSGHTEEILGFV